MTEEVLEQDLDRDGQRREVDPVGDGIESIEVGQPLAEGRPGAEWVDP